MSTMVNDLLEYSRTQLGGKMPMAPVPADMRDIVQAALHNAASAHPDCIFELHLRGDLSGVFDDVRLQQVVVNLLANAAQYRAKGTNVKLDVSGELNDVLLSVTNFGPAIPPESLKTIFSAMVQLPVDGEQPGRPRTSLGLGLFIARELRWPTVARSTSRLPMLTARPLQSAFPAPLRRQKRQWHRRPEHVIASTPRTRARSAAHCRS